MGGVFGKPAKSTSTQQSTQSSDSHSFNANNDLLKSAFGGTAAQTGNTSNALASLLGVGGTPGSQDEAFNNYKDSTGYGFQLKSGQDAITGSAAAKGLLDSGSTAKGLTQFGQDLASTKFNDYLNGLFQLGNLGTSAGGILANSGQESVSHSEGQSSGTSTSKGAKQGLGGAIGGGSASIALSDRRAKRDIVRLYTRPDGLSVYEYKYLSDDTPRVGVMADEVKELMPEALGPIIDGYMTVNYDKIGAL